MGLAEVHVVDSNPEMLASAEQKEDLLSELDLLATSEQHISE